MLQKVSVIVPARGFGMIQGPVITVSAIRG